jgi:hypothetical protein
MVRGRSVYGYKYATLLPGFCRVFKFLHPSIAFQFIARSWVSPAFSACGVGWSRVFFPTECHEFPPSDKVSASSNDLPYNYVPTEWVCIMFAALFSLSSGEPSLDPMQCFVCLRPLTKVLSVAHVAQAIRFRLWWLFPTAVLCGLLEVIGWCGRLWSSKNPHLHKPFVMQWVPVVVILPCFERPPTARRDRISTTIVAPTPLVAANFIILGRITRRLGPQFCRLSPRLCEWPGVLGECPRLMGLSAFHHRLDIVSFFRERCQYYPIVDLFLMIGACSSGARMS